MTASGKRIAFILPNLGGGGTERLTVDLAHAFADRGHDVHIALLAAEGELMAELGREIAVHDLNCRRLRDCLGPLRRFYRNVAPDVVIAAMWPLTSLAVVARIGLTRAPRLVISDHCPLSRQYPDRIGVLKATMRVTYPMADAVVGASRGLSAEIARLCAMAHDRVMTINNPIPQPLTTDREIGGLWPADSDKRILTVGKLKPEKNHTLLLRAFARLDGRSRTSLAIVGQGPEEGNLRSLAAELGIADRVIFPGFTPHPGDWYASADAFALASDYEGFGNVLVEAMHFGLPIVSTDCPYGPSEILGGGEWGILCPVNDVEAMAAGLSDALSRPVDASRQRQRAMSYSLERAVDGYAVAAGLSPRGSSSDEPAHVRNAYDTALKFRA